MKFNELGLDEKIIEAIGYMGIEDTTPIQEKAIPKILDGSDILGCAQTGTGKTAAFVIPVLNEILKTKKKGVRALIIVPTRELAMQVDQQIQGIAYFTNAQSRALYGGGDGSDWVNEKKALTEGADIIVATPGKIIAHLRMGYVDFSSIEFFILDEADKMLDIGFYEDIIEIKSHIPKNSKHLLFSATMPPKVSKLANKILNSPEKVNLEVSKPAEGVEQGIFAIYEKDKFNLLNKILSDNLDLERILVFTATKKKINEITGSLKNKKHDKIEGISSELDQKKREEILQSFRAKNTRVLIATDILSRGIDIKDIDLVINYDVPGDPEDYVHRVGRTARAKTTGMAVTFVSPEEMYKFDRIEKLIEAKIERGNLPEEIGEQPEWKVKNNNKSRNFKSPYKGKNFKNKKR